MSSFKNRFLKKKSSAPDDPINELKKTVHALTRNPNLELDDDKMKKIKEMCKFSSENIPHLYHFLMMQLRKDNSEVRFIMLLAINDFFIRSHCFRKLLENDFEEFLELVVETKSRKPLPPPKTVAKRLKTKAIHFVKEWFHTFGTEHNVLKNAFSYLRSCKKIDLGRERSSTSHTSSQNSLSGAGMTEFFRRRKEMEEHSEEIFSMLTQMERCFQMLLPAPDDLFGDCCNTSSSSANNAGSFQLDVLRDSSDIVDNNSLREHGIIDRSTVVTIDLNSVSSFTVKKDVDTAPILESLQTMHNKIKDIYLPMVLQWLDAFKTESGCSNLVKKAAEFKSQLESKVKKYEQLNQSLGSSSITDDESDTTDSSDSDNDFEEVVEKEGYEATVPELQDQQPSTSKMSNGFSYGDSLSTIDKGNVDDELNLPSTSCQSQNVPHWQDPILLAELQAATGVNLKMPEKKDRQKNSRIKDKGQSKKSGRANAKKISDTTYVRLQKKIRKLKRLGIK